MAATRLPLTRLTPDAPDRELLERYVRERDERAFAALVARHGRMVKAVCRRVLGNDADADDATQAALLVFARKAAGIRDRNGLANWLFGVAHRVAAKARQTRTRRLAKEKQAPPRPPQQVATDFADLLQVELAKLPAAYRAAVLLCDLEGHTVADAAKHLGIPAGTVASRLARGRTRLADRLRSLGLSVSAGLVAAWFTDSTSAAVRFDPDPPAHILSLAEQVMRTAFTLPRLALLSAVVGGVSLVLAAGAGGQSPIREGQPIKAPVPKDKEKKEHPLVGSWEPAESGGPARDTPPVVTFQADGKVKYEQGDQVEWGWYKLDATKEPAEIEYATPARANPENKKPPFLGLVKVEDDVLTLCLNEKARPAEFEQADGTLLSSYRRVKAERRELVKADPPKPDPQPKPKPHPAADDKPAPPKGFAPFDALSQALVERDGDDKLKVWIQVPIGRFLKLTDAKGRAVQVHESYHRELGPQGVAVDDAELFDLAGNEKAKADWKKLLNGRTQVLYAMKKFHDPKMLREQYGAFLKDDVLVLVVSEEVNAKFEPLKGLPDIESLPQVFPGQPTRPNDPVPPKKR
jgi:RNA polymerase sigma factor (sigma-70 family)